MKKSNYIYDDSLSQIKNKNFNLSIVLFVICFCPFRLINRCLFNFNLLPLVEKLKIVTMSCSINLAFVLASFLLFLKEGRTTFLFGSVLNLLTFALFYFYLKTKNIAYNKNINIKININKELIENKCNNLSIKLDNILKEDMNYEKEFFKNR